MIRIFRNKKMEQAILRSDDISYCRRCGKTSNIWIGWNGDYSRVDSIICTRCGWVCGNGSFKDVITLKMYEIKEKIKMLIEK